MTVSIDLITFDVENVPVAVTNEGIRTEARRLATGPVRRDDLAVAFAESDASSVEVRPRIDDRVPFVEELQALPDFVRAYEPGGLAVDEFDTWAPTVRTLRAFTASYHDLLHLVGDALLPNPDA